jgi:predicted DNA-binding transcriptional regulator AlpA
MQSIMSTGDGDGFLPARKVWERYGVTSQTLWRWIYDDKLNFPPPIYINRFRYWKISSLIAWERTRSSRGEPASARLRRAVRGVIRDHR